MKPAIIITLTNGTGVFVDAEDEHFVAGKNWYENAYGYAYRWAPGREAVFIHRLVMGLRRGDGGVVDHIDGDPLNCQKSNLRITDKRGNALNAHRAPKGKSRFYGVTWHKQNQKWWARTRVGGKDRSLGLFRDEEDAARAYDEGALKYHGEHCRRNFS